MDYAKESLRLHEQWGGKIEVNARVYARRGAAVSGDPARPG